MKKKLELTGAEKVTYFNNSPDVLTYIWLQLDENEHNNIRNAGYQTSTKIPDTTTTRELDKSAFDQPDNGNGVVIQKITDALGKELKYIHHQNNDAC
ncbi:hypothetical protein [Pedobacter sp. NJ-S-72]